jgi:hypothetical protein
MSAACSSAPPGVSTTSPQDKLQVASEHTWSSKINKDCTPAVGKLPDAGDCSIQDGKGKPISCDPTLDPRDYTP